jgi:hypothetical protein
MNLTKVEEPIYKRPWFITLMSALVISGGFLALFFCLKESDKAYGVDEFIGANSILSTQSTLYMFLYCLVVCLIAYLVAQFGFNKEISVTMNTFDSILLPITAVAFVTTVIAYAATEEVNAVAKWASIITIVCFIVTLVLSAVANWPNPLYVFISILAKMFILTAIVIAILIILTILLITIIMAILSRSGTPKWEIVGYSSFYDAFLVRRVG